MTCRPWTRPASSGHRDGELHPGRVVPRLVAADLQRPRLIERVRELAALTGLDRDGILGLVAMAAPWPSAALRISASWSAWALWPPMKASWATSARVGEHDRTVSPRSTSNVIGVNALSAMSIWTVRMSPPAPTFAGLSLRELAEAHGHSAYDGEADPRAEPDQRLTTWNAWRWSTLPGDCIFLPLGTVAMDGNGCRGSCFVSGSGRGTKAAGAVMERHLTSADAARRLGITPTRCTG